MIPKLLSSLQNKFKKVQGVSRMLLPSQPFHMPEWYLTWVKHLDERRKLKSLLLNHLSSGPETAALLQREFHGFSPTLAQYFVSVPSNISQNYAYGHSSHAGSMAQPHGGMWSLGLGPPGEDRAVGLLWARHLLQSTDISSPCNSRTCICRHISRVLLCVGRIPPQALLLLHSLGSKCQAVHQEQSNGLIPFIGFLVTLLTHSHRWNKISRSSACSL